MTKSYIPLDLLLECYAHLKKPTKDILPDFAFILEYQIRRFDDYLPNDIRHRLSDKLKTAKRCKSKPKSRNRLYLITDIDIPELILFNVEECILDNLMYTCDIIGIPDPFSMFPDFSNTLFIFSSDRERPYISELHTKTFSEILRCFHSENELDNHNVRESWRNGPRRSGRSHD